MFMHSILFSSLLPSPSPSLSHSLTLSFFLSLPLSCATKHKAFITTPCTWGQATTLWVGEESLRWYVCCLANKRRCQGTQSRLVVCPNYRGPLKKLQMLWGYPQLKKEKRRGGGGWVGTVRCTMAKILKQTSVMKMRMPWMPRKWDFHATMADWHFILHVLLGPKL